MKWKMNFRSFKTCLLIRFLLELVGALYFDWYIRKTLAALTIGLIKQKPNKQIVFEKQIKWSAMSVQFSTVKTPLEFVTWLRLGFKFHYCSKVHKSSCLTYGSGYKIRNQLNLGKIDLIRMNKQFTHHCDKWRIPETTQFFAILIQTSFKIIVKISQSCQFNWHWIIFSN